MKKKEEETLLKIAREAIEKFTRGKKITYSKGPEKKRGIFVTLKKEGTLRGCIGFPYPTYPLYEAVKEAAISACRDPRFEPLQVNELKKIKIEISVLSDPELIEASGEEILQKIQPKKDGLILKYRERTGLFLPQVWSQLPAKKEFLINLCYKAGLQDPSIWMDPETKLYKFRVEVFSE